MQPTGPEKATRDLLNTVPSNRVGEVIDGVLHSWPRPPLRQATAVARISSQLEPAFGRGVGGPGGWVIVQEPGLEFERAAEIVPDLAGWRVERLQNLGLDDAIKVVPDWVCEPGVALRSSSAIRSATLPDSRKPAPMFAC